VHGTVAGTIRLLIALIATGTADPSAASESPPVDHCGPVQPVGDQPAPDVAYGLARKAWSVQTAPAAVDYVVLVRLRNGEKPTAIHYRGEEDLAADTIHVDRFSDEEVATPYVPRGINVVVGLSVSLGSKAVGQTPSRPSAAAGGILLSRPEPSFDLLGTPHLSATYAFGIKQLPETPAGPAGSSALKTIGKVSVVSRTYSIRCDTELTPDEGAVHLFLEPLRDARNNRLREMWIDPLTDHTLRIRTAGNFRDGPPLHCDWSITFTTIGGVTYIDKEVALGPLDYGRNKIYRDVTISFERIEPLARSTLRTLLHQLPSEYDLLEPR
jgi:hypothetical protein